MAVIHAYLSVNARGEFQIEYCEQGALAFAVYWNSVATHDAIALQERFILARGSDRRIQWGSAPLS